MSSSINDPMIAAFAVETEADPTASEDVRLARASKRANDNPAAAVASRDAMLEKRVRALAAERAKAILRAQDDEREKLTSVVRAEAAKNLPAWQVERTVQLNCAKVRPDLYRDRSVREAEARQRGHDLALQEVAAKAPHLTAHLGIGVSPDLAGRTPSAWARDLYARTGAKGAPSRQTVDLAGSARGRRALATEFSRPKLKAGVWYSTSHNPATARKAQGTEDVPSGQWWMWMSDPRQAGGRS